MSDAAGARLGGILLGALALRLFLVAAIPPGESPDERAHFEYARFLADERSFPVQTERTGDGDRYEYYQPPLFYLLAAPVHAAAGGGLRSLYAIRLLNAGLSLLAIAAMVRFARDAAPGRETVAASVAAFAGFLPAFATNGSAVTNDPLLVLLSAFALLLLARTLRSGDLPVRRGVALSALLGLALLTKPSGIAVWVAVAAGLGLARRPGAAAAIFAGAALVALPWHLRNLSVYGRLLPLEVANVEWDDRPAAAEAALRLLGLTARSFWVAFGRFNDVEVLALRPLLYLLSAGAVVAFVVWVVRHVGDADPGSRSITIASVGGVATLAALLVFFGWRYGQAQGRFLFPMLGPIATAVCLGAERCVSPGRAWRVPIAIGAVLLALLAVTFAAELIPRYYPSLTRWVRS